MTDGIIQEVFKEFIKEHPTVWRYHTDVLQKELIAKIKQEVDKMQMSIIYRDGLKRVLIGDNQE